MGNFRHVEKLLALLGNYLNAKHNLPKRTLENIVSKHKGNISAGKQTTMQKQWSSSDWNTRPYYVECRPDRKQAQIQKHIFLPRRIKHIFLLTRSGYIFPVTQDGIIFSCYTGTVTFSCPAGTKRFSLLRKEPIVIWLQ